MSTKFIKLALMLCAATSFAACSSDDDLSSTTPKTLEDGGTVAVSINLPKVPLSRAASPDLNDGSANEYDVKSADVALYAVNGIDTFCVGVEHFAKEQLQFSMSGTNNDKITSVSAVVNVPAHAVTPTLALAILNEADGVALPVIGDKYSMFENTPVTAIATGMKDGFFMMTNSTFATAGGSVQSLATIDPASISKNASVKPTTVTQIYVERVNAKVQLSMPLESESTYGTADLTGDMPVITFINGDKLKITGWDLTVTNKSYFPVKMIGNNAADWSNITKYQMSTLWTDPTRYRSYWAIDPNYNSAFKGQDRNSFNYKSLSEIATSKLSDGNNIKYCLENTFNADAQNKNQTTAVIIKGIYTLSGTTEGSDVYRISGTAYKLDDIKTYLAERLKANGYTVKDAADVDASKIMLTNDVSANKISVSYDGGALMTKGGTDVTINDAVIASFGSDRTISFYPGGVCYYTVQIKNFGDDVKLYNDNGTYYQYNGNASFAGINTSDKLGRYGVVRNTWYNIKINSISGLGAPGPQKPDQPINPDPNYPDPDNPDPNTPPTPDDTENYYINAQINILPWALRFQSAEL